MKVFLVVTARDGETRKEVTPSSVKNVTDIQHIHTRYAAETIEEVINYVTDNLMHEETLITIHEEHPAISILKT